MIDCLRVTALLLVFVLSTGTVSYGFDAAGRTASVTDWAIEPYWV